MLWRKDKERSVERSKTSPKRLYPARPKRNSHVKTQCFPGRRISKCKGPEVGPCPDGLRNSQKVNVESDNLRRCKASRSPLLEGLVWCPVAPEALDPGQLHVSSGLESFYCNRICSLGFALEHQIKSTPGVGVNGEAWHLLYCLPESLEAYGSKGFHFIHPPVSGHGRFQANGTGPN